MQRAQFNQQHLVNDSLEWPTVVKAQCSIGSEIYPDRGINCNYAIDKFSRAYRGSVS